MSAPRDQRPDAVPLQGEVRRAVMAARTPLLRPTRPSEVWGLDFALAWGPEGADADGGGLVHTRGPLSGDAGGARAAADHR